MAGFRAGSPGRREGGVHLVAQGDILAGRFRCSESHLGRFLGYEPTGKGMDVEEVFFARADGGLFVDFWGPKDSLGGMRQPGLQPPGR